MIMKQLNSESSTVDSEGLVMASETRILASRHKVGRFTGSRVLGLLRRSAPRNDIRGSGTDYAGGSGRMQTSLLLKQSQFAAGFVRGKCFLARGLRRFCPVCGFCKTKPNGARFCRPKWRGIRREDAVAPRSETGSEKPCPNPLHGLQSSGNRYITRF